MKIAKCACTGTAELLTNNTIFAGLFFGSRYPEPIASQSNGYKIRCMMCGMQTCWWHLKNEAINAWNDPEKFINMREDQ